MLLCTEAHAELYIILLRNNLYNLIFEVRFILIVTLLTL
jgi:hypothetical protein